ncbi:hypothetical protein SteCoe_2285 [Stentor coeruleus]|uniref:Uncharacterized protein n=1 Tax=Stentor coeruleus TaxID=5963 RepID=A0A1R2CZV7_9CILI|nr:hypothetical protein SteCoe_2285 [Stentor coeruleus]
MQNYGNLVNTFSDYLMYDERKGRILHTRYLNKAQFYEMWRFHFNRLRPDLSDHRNKEFIVAQRITRGLLAVLRNYSLVELKRHLIVNEQCYPEGVNDIIINHLNYLAPSQAGVLIPKTVSWIDATKNFVYLQKVCVKIQSFGLHYPSLSEELTQEQKAQMEEQLYQYFKKLLTTN